MLGLIKGFRVVDGGGPSNPGKYFFFYHNYRKSSILLTNVIPYKTIVCALEHVWVVLVVIEQWFIFDIHNPRVVFCVLHRS